MEEVQGWRHVRLQQTGKNASGQTHYLSLSGFEIYGTVTGVCEDLGKAYSTHYLSLSGFEVYGTVTGVREDLGKDYSTHSSGQTHCISLSGFEIYGTVPGVFEDLGKAYSANTLPQPLWVRDLWHCDRCL
jgi:hypothetical protein